MKKTISIFLSLVVLVSSTGIAMTTHYCGGYAMDMEVALGHAHLDCGMEDMDKCPGDNNKQTINEQVCCNNVSISSDVDSHNLQILKSFNPEFVVALTVTYLRLFIPEVDTETTYNNYSPPLRLRDISILNQVFII